MNKFSAKNNFRKTKATIVFAIIFSQVFLVNAAIAAPVLDWENPNKTGNMEPYKFKMEDVLNSDLMTQVVGCTGIVEKVSFALSNFTQSIFNKGKKAAVAAAKAEIIRKVCKGGKKAGESGTAALDGTSRGSNFTTWLKDFIDCDEITKAKKTDEELANEYDKAQKEDSQRRMEQCFEGIAFTLAKNQLTSMTRYAINWVNTGFGGDPFFVKNTQSLLTNLQRDVFEKSLNYLMPTKGYYPYSRSFAKAVISQNRLQRKGLEALSNLSSTLGNFVSDPNSYVNMSDVEKAASSVKLFNEDFNNGGWGAWGAFSQNEANNPLGYYMLASEMISEQQELEATKVKDELYQNNGFLSQKRCARYSEQPSLKVTTGNAGQAQTTKEIKVDPVCVEWEVVTPGSIIKDKLSYYLNSPERQLEMADSINEVLNSVFSMLLSRLADQGVLGITAKERAFEYNGSDFNSSEFLNKLQSDIDGTGISSLGSTGGYSSGKFNLTKDLGNQYNYNYTSKSYLGTWNASKNTATRLDGITEKLLEGIGPIVIDANDNKIFPINVYYTVNVPGKTSLFKDGYNGWEVGDRAFWDGEKWQNWKCGGVDKNNQCLKQKHPIYKKGVIQIQEDYKVAARELLQNLPTIMPKLGELDYCIPGPNINWARNYEDAASAFSDFAYSLSSQYKPGSWFLARDASVFEIAQPGDPLYDDYEKIFKGSPSLWTKVQSTQTWQNIQRLGSMGAVKKDKIEENIKENINRELDNISKGLSVFRDEYGKLINEMFGKDGILQTEFLYFENKEDPVANPNYLEAARASTPILENIIQYEEDIEELTSDTKENIVVTDSNLYKLENIKNEVSTIIKEAQKVRNEKMLEKLNSERALNNEEPLIMAKFELMYADCMKDENMNFYHDTEILKDTSKENERCFDGLDNDWDGLTDEGDPDCSGVPMTGSGEQGGPMNPGDSAFGNPDDAFENPDDAFNGQN